ncbi:hypothetical protein [Microbulbifer halophilus]
MSVLPGAGTAGKPSIAGGAGSYRQPPSLINLTMAQRGLLDVE